VGGALNFIDEIQDLAPGTVPTVDFAVDLLLEAGAADDLEHLVVVALIGDHVLSGLLDLVDLPGMEVRRERSGKTEHHNDLP